MKRFLLLLLLLFFFLPPRVFAESGISVTPSLVRIDLKTDPSEVSLYYKNTTKNTIELNLQARDFTQLEDRGDLLFLKPQEAQNYHYALSTWIHFNTDSLVLEPGEGQAVTISIDKARLPLGGHYASVLAQITDRTAGAPVKVQGMLSTLVFVRAPAGNERETGVITYFGKDSPPLTLPDNFILRFQNTGNVETIPYGTINIYDFLGRKTATGILNEGSLITLPETIRRYDIPVTWKTTFLFPGLYHATLTTHFGKSNHMTKETVFFTEGSIPLIPVLGVLIIVCFILYKKRKQSMKDDR